MEKGTRLLVHLSTDEFRSLLKEIVKEVLTENNNDRNNSQTLLNVQEAAALLNLAVNTLYEKTSEKLVPHYKHGKKIMFKKSELLAWVESRKVKTVREVQQDATALKAKRKS